MTSHHWMIACLFASTLTVGTAGCTTMKTLQPTAPPAPVFDRLKAGDTVVVETQDGRQVRFVVQQIDGDGILSQDGVRYNRADIAQLQRRSVSPWKTGLLVAGAAYAAVYAVLVAMFA